MLARADFVLHTGDFTSLATLVELETHGRLEAVHGNVDDAEVQAILPARRVVEAEGLRIGLVHDPGAHAGRSERLLSWFSGCDVIAYGHTHLPEIRRAGDTWIVNPGSPTERRRAPFHSMALLRRGRPVLVEL